MGPETDPEVPASPATRSPAAKSPGSASRRRSPLGLRTSPGGPVRRLLGPKSPGTAFGAARDAPGGGPSRPAAAPEGAPRPAPDADGCVTPPDPFAPTPSKRRRVTFAEVDAYDMAEEDEDAEEPPESPASAPARWGVFGSPGDAEPSDGDRSAGPSAASLGGANNGAEASAPSPEWAKRTRVVPNEDASGRGGGSPMSPDYAGNHPSGTPRRSPGAATTASPPRRGARARADEAEPEGAAEGFEAFDALDGGGGGGGSSGGGRPLRLRDGNARRLDAAARLAVADEAQRKAKARKAGTPKKDEKKSTPTRSVLLFSRAVSPAISACGRRPGLAGRDRTSPG